MDDVYLIDKARVRMAFGRAAKLYDNSAVLQKQVRDEMMNRLALVKLTPQRILDAGCGTGAASALLKNKFKGAQVLSLDFALPMLQKTRQLQRFASLDWLRNFFSSRQALICADIEALPIANATVDLVWSNLAIQWCNDLDQTFAEFHRVLQAEGLLMFTTFGPDTLKELRAATQAVHGDAHTSVSRFIDMHDIGDALVRAGFHAPVLDVERFTLTYDDVTSLMRDLKSIGAHNATAGRARGLLGRGFLAKLAAHYEQYRLAPKSQGGQLPLTYEVVYGHAWRGQDKPSNVDGVSPINFKPRNK